MHKAKLAIAKMFIQRLWEEGFAWDESLLQHLHHKWLPFRERLKTLNDVKFSKYVHKGLWCGSLHIINKSERHSKSEIKQIPLPKLKFCAVKIVACVKLNLELREIDLILLAFYSPSLASSRIIIIFPHIRGKEDIHRHTHNSHVNLRQIRIDPISQRIKSEKIKEWSLRTHLFAWFIALLM